jgi:chromosome segregation ATPase
MDFKVADLRKKLNKLKFETKEKTDRIARLMKDYEKVVNLNAEMEKAEEILEDSAEGQRLRFLENEIHKTNLKLMEGETIKKKYMTILDMLKKERLTFGNQIEGLETQLRKQEDEIEKLKVRKRLKSTEHEKSPWQLAFNKFSHDLTGLDKVEQ